MVAAIRLIKAADFFVAVRGRLDQGDGAVLGSQIEEAIGVERGAFTCTALSEAGLASLNIDASESGAAAAEDVTVQQDDSAVVV